MALLILEAWLNPHLPKTLIFPRTPYTLIQLPPSQNFELFRKKWRNHPPCWALSSLTGAQNTAASGASYLIMADSRTSSFWNIRPLPREKGQVWSPGHIMFNPNQICSRPVSLQKVQYPRLYVTVPSGLVGCRIAASWVFLFLLLLISE